MLVLTFLLTLLLSRSDRVKSCDLHPTEQWMLVSLYNGNVHIWNYESQQLVKSFEVRATTPLFLANLIWPYYLLGLRPASQSSCICAKEELGGHRFWWHAGRFFREIVSSSFFSDPHFQLQHPGEAACVWGAFWLCQKYCSSPDSGIILIWKIHDW